MLLFIILTGTTTRGSFEFMLTQLDWTSLHESSVRRAAFESISFHDSVFQYGHTTKKV